MCPFCIGSAVWIAAATTSTGGIAALVVSRLRSKNDKNQESTSNNKNHEQGDSHE